MGLCGSGFAAESMNCGLWIRSYVSWLFPPLSIYHGITRKFTEVVCGYL